MDRLPDCPQVNYSPVYTGPQSFAAVTGELTALVRVHSLGPGSSTRRRQVSQAAIDQITTMFPNVSQYAARWELERNGGNVERAVERALREGGLPEVRLPFSSSVRSTLAASDGGIFTSSVVFQEAASSRTNC